MVRINLLKKTVRKRAEGPKIPVRVYVIAGVTAGIACLVFAGIWISRTLLRPEPEKEYVVEKDLRPSTYSKAHAVEEVVREHDDLGDKIKRSGVLDLPYEELATAEKINYEIHFARNVCELLATTVPQGIGFRTLSGEAFRRISGETYAASRELITHMLTELRRAGVDPLPPPASVIRKTGSKYKFTFKADVEFGLNLREPFIDLELHHLTSREGLPHALQKLGMVARKNGVRLNGTPRKLSAEAAGEFRKFRYRLTGVCSYVQFVRFVQGLHEERVPCAFENFRLVAQTRDRLTFNAQILFTTLD
ncbi:MAG: hypothetical protein GF418_04045 [Chitinivibrionales bacterium]|nr:hypothetical protein [Chitinivibrionales bacterium]MBD3394778.1 hypothetical protein [Chitinivibrionales bacterium]